MHFDRALHPELLVFYRESFNLSCGYSQKIIVDVSGCKILHKHFIEKSRMMHILECTISKTHIEQLIRLVNRKTLTAYAAIPDEQKTETGYRDGWSLHYKVLFRDPPSFSGILNLFYQENPLEQALDFLRQVYSDISSF
ncbi:MAG: hypothetical protein IK130_01595 [Oscillospiraceae bacterium]|nr:hypothetical protein [Oscillospiraceae bacterium]